jgi:hypothetical protein
MRGVAMCSSAVMEKGAGREGLLAFETGNVLGQGGEVRDGGDVCLGDWAARWRTAQVGSKAFRACRCECETGLTRVDFWVQSLVPKVRGINSNMLSITMTEEASEVYRLLPGATEASDVVGGRLCSGMGGRWDFCGREGLGGARGIRRDPTVGE